MNKNVAVTDRDVDNYMRWMDENHDNKISLPEFENVVKRSLEAR